MNQHHWQTIIDALDRTEVFDPSIGATGGAVARASVAVVLHSTEPAEKVDVAKLDVLLIQRATREGDPWSGQMAFPGGRAEPHDDSDLQTAVRETHEEVGLDLSAATALGSVRTINGSRATGTPLLVSAHGFGLHGERPQLQPNEEVAEAIWMPLAYLADSQNRISHYHPPVDSMFPGIQLKSQNQVVWGLTLRFLEDFMSRLLLPK